MMLAVSRNVWSKARLVVTRSMVTVGDKVPNVELFSGFPPEKKNVRDICANKSVILVGLPGTLSTSFHIIFMV